MAMACWEFGKVDGFHNIPPLGLQRSSLSKLFAIVLDRNRGTQLGVALVGFKQSMTNISAAND
jgi:hypothetical protein